MNSPEVLVEIILKTFSQNKTLITKYRGELYERTGQETGAFVLGIQYLDNRDPKQKEQRKGEEITK